jgi:molybdate transport system substrate-binding protein
LRLLVSLAVILADSRFPLRSRSQTSKQELTVSAAVSLKDALDRAAALYRSQKPGTVVHFNRGDSGTWQRQIEQGAPVDVFISAAPEEMDKLESKDLLLQGTQENLARNHVVLIVPAGEVGIKSFQDLG